MNEGATDSHFGLGDDSVFRSKTSQAQAATLPQCRLGRFYRALFVYPSVLST